MSSGYTHFLATLTKSGRGTVHVIDGTNRPECRQRGHGGYVTPIEGSKDELLGAEYVKTVHAGMVLIGAGCRKCYDRLGAHIDVAMRSGV